MNILMTQTIFDPSLVNAEVMVLTMNKDDKSITDAYKGNISQIFENGQMCMTKHILTDKKEIFNIDDIGETYQILKYDYILYQEIKSHSGCKLHELSDVSKDRILPVAIKDTFLKNEIVLEKFMLVESSIENHPPMYFTIDSLSYINSRGPIKKISLRKIGKTYKRLYLIGEEISLDADIIKERIEYLDKHYGEKIDNLVYSEGRYIMIDKILTAKDAEYRRLIDIYYNNREED